MSEVRVEQAAIPPISPEADRGPLSAIEEAARQVNICNACRYCEGYCSVFPAITSARTFSEADITQLANLCHNCRGCYYACQYAPPHEFALNLPKALAEVRQESWQDFAFPVSLGRIFHRSGAAVAVLAVLAFAARSKAFPCRSFASAPGSGQRCPVQSDAGWKGPLNLLVVALAFSF